ncbi:hypothetical protein D6745_00840 [Candidatus Woesearchaeota archaeon]|nr:MAG: hypothetical protein D6745_00840 [Candidatus Woesearchaeota archaeon]
MKVYGVIADPHGATGVVKTFLPFLKKQGVDAIILNGDLNDHWHQEGTIEKILRDCSRLRVPVFAHAGSHEMAEEWEHALKAVKRVKNIVNANEERVIKYNDHHLVFLPGSRARVAGGQFVLGGGKKNTGKHVYHSRDWGDIPYYFFNINDLSDLVDAPEKTVLVGHEPPRFTRRTGIDMAHFGTVTEDFVDVFGNKYSKGSVTPLKYAERHVKNGHPVRIQKTNRGSSLLARIISELGIKKGIFGHFHENAGLGNFGCDAKGARVEQGVYSQELFFNPGAAYNTYAGIFVLDNGKAMYHVYCLEPVIK